MLDSVNNKSQRIIRLRNRTAGFSKKEGRRPRILITRIHFGGSDRAVKTMATAFADIGFDVDINTGVQSPANIARTATENDVHVVGIPGITVKSGNRISGLIKALEENGRGDILVVIWGSVHPVNRKSVFNPRKHKIEIFGIKTDPTISASRILDSLKRRH